MFLQFLPVIYIFFLDTVLSQDPSIDMLYAIAFLQNSVLSEIQQVIRNAQLEENKKRELACALHVHFKDWLYGIGHILFQPFFVFFILFSAI